MQLQSQTVGSSLSRDAACPFLVQLCIFSTMAWISLHDMSAYL